MENMKFSSVGTALTQQAADRAEIASLTEEFLARGGEIIQLDPSGRRDDDLPIPVTVGGFNLNPEKANAAVARRSRAERDKHLPVVKDMVQAGHTFAEMEAATGLTYRTLVRLMQDHGITQPKVRGTAKAQEKATLREDWDL